MRARWILSGFIGACIGLVPAVANATTASLPFTIVSAGDSITRGFDAGFDCILQDCPQYSWSTGDSGVVLSQYARLLALNPALSGRNFNLAKTGAKMADLVGQLQIAGYFKADYVTVLIGGNDLCTSTTSTMTPTQTFFQNFYSALAQFFYYDPNGKVFVSSIPDLLQLWNTLHTNSNAVGAWSTFHICQSMLSTANTDADRTAVENQEAIDNYILANVCAAFPNCRWDGYAVNAFRFPVADVSPIDFFHPSVRGQADLAAVTWARSFWAT